MLFFRLAGAVAFVAIFAIAIGYGATVLNWIALAAAILIGWTVFGLIVGLIVGPFLKDLDE